jgi:hypothetical protein
MTGWCWGQGAVCVCVGGVNVKECKACLAAGPADWFEGYTESVVFVVVGAHTWVCCSKCKDWHCFTPVTVAPTPQVICRGELVQQHDHFMFFKGKQDAGASACSSCSFQQQHSSC